MYPSDKNIADVVENQPLISVVMPSYNHAKYLNKAVDSVLSQDFGNFELLISDDASVDNSWEIISGYNDPRIHSFRQKQNLGPVGNLVFLIKKARGKYIALLNSDDAWYQEKLSKQIIIMESQPSLGACFTWADMVDERGQEISGPDAIWNDIFHQPNRTQGEWLRHFFFKGNCLCHPSILVRKKIYDELGFYNPGLKQLPDFEMWIRLIKHYPIHVIQESLVAHLRDGNNTSAVSPKNSVRNLTELIEIFDSFLEDIPDEIFIEGFVDDFRLKGVLATPTRLRCEKLFLLLENAFARTSGRIAALSSFIKHFSNPDIERTLRDEYGFSVFDFYCLTGSSEFNHAHTQITSAHIQRSSKSLNGLSITVGDRVRYLKQLVRRLL